MFDGLREFALVPGTHARALARHDLAERRQIAAQGVGVLVVDVDDVGLAEMAMAIDAFLHNAVHDGNRTSVTRAGR